MSILEAQREYEVLFSTHKPGSKVDRWQWDGTLVVKNDKIELYDEDGNHKDTKTIDARNFISTMHEGGVFAMPKFKVQISKILSGFEKGLFVKQGKQGPSAPTLLSTLYRRKRLYNLAFRQRFP